MLSASTAGHDRPDLAAVGARSTSHADRAMTGLIFQDGATRISASQFVGHGEITDAVAKIGIGIVEPAYGAAVAEARCRALVDLRQPDIGPVPGLGAVSAFDAHNRVGQCERHPLLGGV